MPNHFVLQGSNNDKTKEFTQARDRGIHVVSPHWLHACQERNERVDESMYPHTFNPKLSLPVVKTGRRLTRSSKAVSGPNLQCNCVYGRYFVRLPLFFVAKCNLGEVQPTPMRPAGGASINPISHLVLYLSKYVPCEGRNSQLFLSKIVS